MTLPDTQKTQAAAMDAKPSRRGFFMGAAALGAGATALTAMRAAPVVPEVAALPAAPAGGGGYSLSAHVKRYYQTTLV
jgi:hypothetical protein